MKMVEAKCEFMSRFLIIGGSGFIGTNLCEYLNNKDIIYKNIDIVEPRVDRQKNMWEKINVLEYSELIKVMLNFKPDILINLAAQTDTTLTDRCSHSVNYLGIVNIVRGIEEIKLRCRIIHFSSMLVNDLGTPATELHQLNSTSWYGRMKARAEIHLNKSTGINYCILRPTSIYGPYMGAPYYELFTMSQRRYLPPYPHNMGLRPFGFVGNVINQVEYVADNFSRYDGRTLYLMDRTDLNVKIISGKIRALLGLSRPVTLHNFVFKFFALIGDILTFFNKKPPLTTTRYKNLITSQVIPEEMNVEINMNEKITTDDGILATINWMKDFKS